MRNYGTFENTWGLILCLTVMKGLFDHSALSCAHLVVASSKNITKHWSVLVKLTDLHLILEKDVCALFFKMVIKFSVAKTHNILKLNTEI